MAAGDRMCFGGRASSSMVKNTSVNGMCLPSIAVMDEKGDCRVVKRFGYEDFKERLG